MLHRVLFALFGLAVLGWATAYVWVGSMACAFVTSNDVCRVKLPWELGREDTLLLVIGPALICAALLALALLAYRVRRTA